MMGVPDFPGIHKLFRDTDFQPVRMTFDFQMARFASDNASSTGQRPVSRWEFIAVIDVLMVPGNPGTPMPDHTPTPMYKIFEASYLSSLHLFRAMERGEFCR
jgi:hypothetical protein